MKESLLSNACSLRHSGMFQVALLNASRQPFHIAYTKIKKKIKKKKGLACLLCTVYSNDVSFEKLKS